MSRPDRKFELTATDILIMQAELAKSVADLLVVAESLERIAYDQSQSTASPPFSELEYIVVLPESLKQELRQHTEILHRCSGRAETITEMISDVVDREFGRKPPFVQGNGGDDATPDV